MMDFPAYTIHDAWDRDAVIGWDPVFHTFFIRSAFFTKQGVKPRPSGRGGKPVSPLGLKFLCPMGSMPGGHRTVQWKLRPSGRGGFHDGCSYRDRLPRVGADLTPEFTGSASPRSIIFAL